MSNGEKHRCQTVNLYEIKPVAEEAVKIFYQKHAIGTYLLFLKKNSKFSNKILCFAFSKIKNMFIYRQFFLLQKYSIVSF